MYTHFFGFREKPFKLVPDPVYLYLSKSHEVALAHLNYALNHGDGFVEITGEVGTGKTTLCRAFLEGLDDKTNAAYIFNPKLGPKQLLKAIYDELNVDDNGMEAQPDIKALIDSLNRFLLHQKSLGHRVVILVDEAQNLQRNVLEQLRLLSNLETAKEKLLQIILVGQPELSQKLDSFELRQLSQRIALRYRLSPLTANETWTYIRYRLSIASPTKGVKFSRSALRQIYAYSRGIPRVINIVCDRALLAAYGLNQHHVSGRVVRASIKELRQHAETGSYRRARWGLFLGWGALAVAVVAALFFTPYGVKLLGLWQAPVKPSKAVIYTIKPLVNEKQLPAKSEKHHKALAPSTKPEPEKQMAAVAEPKVLIIKPVRFVDELKQQKSQNSRRQAWIHILKRWQVVHTHRDYLDNVDDDNLFFRFCAQTDGFVIHRVKANLELLRRLDLPAILALGPPGSKKPGYAVLDKIDGPKIILVGLSDTKVLETTAKELENFWDGTVYIPWKNFLAIFGSLPIDYSKGSIITLKMLLKDIGADDIDLSPVYDLRTQGFIRKIQSRHGLLSDGIVGPLTKIILYRAQNRFAMPQIVASGAF
jgi:general secretion pathway protein A